MSLPRILVVALLSAGCATADRVQQLEEKVASLEKKVEAVEKAPRAASGSASAVDPALEEKAKALYEEINTLASSGEMEAAKTKMGTLQKDFAATTTAKRARKLAAELEVVGKASPLDWDKNVEKWYTGEGKVNLNEGTNLVVFWEVWCPHCKREVPALKETYEKYNGKGMNVVGFTKITRSATEEKVTEFIQEQDLNYPTAKENGELSKHFGVSGIPAAAVVKDGKVVWRGHPARLNDEMIGKWL